MKKIGILTFHNTSNYGALLQVFALQKKIEQLNGNCEIINYHCDSIEKREHAKFPKLEKDILKFIKDVVVFFRNYKKRNANRKFSNKYLTISEKEYYRNTIAESNNIYDKFLVGSDMVWELGITGGDTTFYLDFADENKRYSYAASLGVEKIEDKYIETCKNNLSKFKHVSVRENQAKDYISTLISNKIYVDADPTLLHAGSFWEKYEEIPKKISDKYILLYFLDKDGLILKTAKKIASENKMDIIVLMNSKNKIDGCTVVSNASIGEFLYYIHNAQLVITGSYHGMIFSMNYNTNFMYLNNSKSASRLENIAQITHSTDRKLTSGCIPKIECNFDEINRAVEEIRESSISYLKTLLN